MGKAVDQKTHIGSKKMVNFGPQTKSHGCVRCKPTQFHSPRGSRYSFRGHVPGAVTTNEIATGPLNFPVGLAAPDGLTLSCAPHFQIVLFLHCIFGIWAHVNADFVCLDVHLTFLGRPLR